MKKIRFFGILIALFSAVSILLISLSSGSAVQSASSGLSQSPTQFYMSDTILPDHVGYSVLMAIDRVRLEAATPTEQVYLKTTYANQRLADAEALLDKGNAGLAVTTLTKAQKYLLSAGSQVLEQDMAPTVTKHVIATIEFHRDHTTTLAKTLTDNQRAVIDGLNEECQVMIQQLSSKL